jgi:hypothetical protein
LNPIALRIKRAPLLHILVEPICNASFFDPALEIFMTYATSTVHRPEPIKSSNAPERLAGFPKRFLSSPERLAGFPNRVFSRDSDIGQQPVVQLTQVPPSLPAIEPNFDGSGPTRQHGSNGRHERTGPNRLPNRE